jgi:hypothetical protein
MIVKTFRTRTAHLVNGTRVPCTGDGGVGTLAREGTDRFGRVVMDDGRSFERVSMFAFLPGPRRRFQPVAEREGLRAYLAIESLAKV